MQQILLSCNLIDSSLWFRTCLSECPVCFLGPGFSGQQPKGWVTEKEGLLPTLLL